MPNLASVSLDMYMLSDVYIPSYFLLNKLCLFDIFVFSCTSFGSCTGKG